MKILRKTYTFGHELMFDDKKFLLGVSFPFRKEEFIKFDWGGEDIDIEGTLYVRLLENLNNDSELRKELKIFLSSWARLLASIRVCRNDSRGKSCFSSRLGKGWTLKDDGKEGRLTFIYLPHREYKRKMTFDNFKIKRGYFHRQTVDIRFSVGRIVIEFFTNSCSQK